jgi:hypothetical protein
VLRQGDATPAAGFWRALYLLRLRHAWVRSVRQAADPEAAIKEFADALAETLAALGVEHVAAYERHTGASIAVEFAARHPQRCVIAFADGFAVFAKPYTDEQLERYLEPIVPTWDGAHLLRLWFRYRDQHVFWPWNLQTAETRSDADVPDLDFLHRGVVELLEAGDDYRIAYAAPFRHRGLEVLRDLRVPVCFGHRPGDSLYASRKLYPKFAWTEIIPREPEGAALAERAILERHPARGAPPPAPPCAPLPGRTTTDYLNIDGAQALVRSAGELAPCLVTLYGGRFSLFATSLAVTQTGVLQSERKVCGATVLHAPFSL